MKRRTLLRGLAFTTVGSAATLGTGAFNTVKAERTIRVDVVDDYDAYLALEQRGGGERSELDGAPGTLEFNLPGDDEGDYPDGSPTNPEGLGSDSVYWFGQDAGGEEVGLFSVQNQGTKPVKVFSTQKNTSGNPSVTIYNAETDELLTEDNRSDPLAVGEEPLLCGLVIDTHGIDSSEYKVDITINAEAVDE